MTRRVINSGRDAGFATLALSALAALAVSACGSAPEVPPSGRHLRGSARGATFRFNIGELSVNLKGAPSSLSRKIRGSQVTARCGRLQASTIWPGDARKLSFGLHPKPAPSAGSLTAHGSAGFDRCGLIPLPGVRSIVSARMHPASRG